MHLVKMSFARGRKMKASAELRAMVEVDPARSSRLSASEVCRFQCRSAEGKILPRTRLRWVRDTFGCEGIDWTICPLFQMRRPLLAFGSETAGQPGHANKRSASWIHPEHDCYKLQLEATL